MISRAEALVLLGSASPHDRLKAARFFGRAGLPEDRSLLKETRLQETVAYVNRALDRAITRLVESLPEVPDEEDEPETAAAVRRHAYAEAVEWVTGALLHEIEPRIGLIHQAAQQEIQDFERSNVRKQLRRLDSTVEGIQELRRAASGRHVREFDLATLIEEICEDVATNDVGISLQGKRPFPLVSDPSLIRLAVTNGIRNAIEAVLASTAPREPYPVVVAWGSTEVEHWVSMRDQGLGLVGAAETAFGIGRTSKKGHSGFGLAIVRRAMEQKGPLCI